MNLDSVKGYVIINGVKYDARDVIKKLQKQGMNVLVDHGLLFIGSEYVRPSVNQEQEYEQCPIINICKEYEKIKKNGLFTKNQVSPNIIDDMPTLTNNTVKSSNIKTEPTISFQKDTIPISDDEVVLPLLEERDINTEPFNFGYHRNSNKRDKIIMKVLNPETKYIPRSKSAYIDDGSKKIPPHLQTICPYCSNIVSKEWLFCGHCGKPLKGRI